MLQTYQRATSYEDYGLRVTEFSGASPHTNQATFETTFVRPDRFRFETDGELIWMDQGKFLRYAGVAIETLPDLKSTKFVSAIPALLVPTGTRTGIAALQRLRLDGAETIDDRPCWRVVGTMPSSGELTLWIDQTSYALRRTFTHRHFPAGIESSPFDTRQTTNYAPILNRAIETARLEGPDPATIPPPPRSPWLGVELDGTRIVRVVGDAPAAQSQLAPGDEVITIDTVPITTAAAVIEHVKHKSVGDVATLVVRRAGVELTISVTVGDRDDFRKLQRALIDRPAPAFTASRVVGSYPASSQDLAGYLLVLDFTATTFKMCDECGLPATFMSKLQDKYGPRGVRVVNLSREAPAVLAQFAKDHQLHHTFAHDPGSAIANAYRTYGPSTIVLVDKRGVIRFVLENTSGVEPAVEYLLDGR